jgi:hypothetical protein
VPRSAGEKETEKLHRLLRVLGERVTVADLLRRGLLKNKMLGEAE